MTITNSAELIILSRTENISLARLAVAAFAAQLDFTLTEIEEIKMAISEAVTNAIVHGYKNKEGVIKVTMHREGDKMQIVVADSGAGMPVEKENNVDAENCGEGLGLMFIENFMDEVEIDTKPGLGTSVKMIIQARKEGIQKKGASSNA